MREEAFRAQFTTNRQEVIQRFKREINLQSVVDKGIKRLEIPGMRPGIKQVIITMEEAAELETALINFYSTPINMVRLLDAEGAGTEFIYGEYLNLVEELADVDIGLIHIMSAFKLDTFVGSLTARCNPCGWSGHIGNELVRQYDINPQTFVNNACLLLEQFIMASARFFRGKYSDDEYKGYVSRCWATLSGIRRVTRIPNEDMRVAEDIKWIRLHERNGSGSFL
ncbi:MAG: hypothetical protein NC548_37730 [Lachnospiraceae bacterium]|nr:hypothetical protein [Lachnospiraceae bacterium]MCM1441381.1 hypothetical protein [Roseburia sp.]